MDTGGGLEEFVLDEIMLLEENVWAWRKRLSDAWEHGAGTQTEALIGALDRAIAAARGMNHELALRKQRCRRAAMLAERMGGKPVG